MIIFFDKKTGRIHGTINGRVHTEEELSATIAPMGVNPEDIGKKVFDINWTRDMEKYQEEHPDYHVSQKKVEVKDGEFVRLVEKDPEPEVRPDSVETMLIDLTKSLEEIQADFSETTRRWIKAAEEEGFTYREIGFNEINLLYQVLEELEDMKDIKIAKRILTIRAPFLDGLRRAFVIENTAKEVVAVALITCVAGNFVYSLGGVTLKGRETHAGDFLIWNLIKDAKGLDYKVFDIGGIYADWADDTKKQVNVFKMRWGGTKAPLGVSNR